MKTEKIYLVFFRDGTQMVYIAIVVNESALKDLRKTVDYRELFCSEIDEKLHPEITREFALVLLAQERLDMSREQSGTSHQSLILEMAFSAGVQYARRKLEKELKGKKKAKK